MVTFPIIIYMKINGLNYKTIQPLIICSTTVILGYTGAFLS